MNGSAHFESVGAPIPEVTRRSLALLAGFELGWDTARETAQEGVTAGAGDCCRRRLLELCEWAGIEAGVDPHAAVRAHLRGGASGAGMVPVAEDAQDVVGWADQVDPLTAKVLCVLCWDAQLPHRRVGYWCPVRRCKAHLTVCAVCGDEPGEHDPADPHGAAALPTRTRRAGS